MPPPKTVFRDHILARTHKSMMNRCYLTSTAKFKRYGARGISVWEPWHDRITFCFAIDALLGPRPEGHTLDRIDNNGDYAEWNVRWATAKQQAENRRKHDRFGARNSMFGRRGENAPNRNHDSKGRFSHV